MIGMRARIVLLASLFLVACFDARIEKVAYPRNNVPYPKVDEKVWQRVEFPAQKSFAYLHKGRAGAPVIIYIHGNAQSAAIRTYAQNHLIKAGYTILIPEFPSYVQGADIAPDEEENLAMIEATMAYAKRAFPRSKLILVGRSLGGALAIKTAARNDVDGLITIGALTRFADFAPRVPEFVFSHHSMDAISDVPKLRAPWVAFHCDADPIVPSFMQIKLVQAARESGVAVKDAMTSCKEHEMPPAMMLEALETF